MAYVVPTEKMMLQPGNHVDTNGQCYLHYLSSWGKNSTSSVVELCDELSKVFAKEPPVFAKPVGRPMQPQPVLPPKVISLSAETAKDTTSPPPLPPFPHELRSQLIRSPTLNKMSEEQQMKPVFEQPNIMDTLIDDSRDDSHRLSVLNRVESMLQNLFDSDVHASLESFQRDSVQIKYAIGKFQKIFEYEFDNLKQLNDHIDQNELVLKRCILEANEATNGANRIKDINIDEMICAGTVVYNQ
jgi:ESCRT-I complex subunit TSG101